MDRFKRILIGLIFICIIVAASTPVSSAAPPSDRCILIKVKVADRDDVNKLANLGLDIWEYREGGMIVRVTDDEREQVKENGFTIETITEDVYEYQEKIRQEQLSLYAEPTTARYHTYDEVIAELQALETSGVAKTYIIGNSWEGRDILAVRISDNPAEDEDEPGALFFGCQHAREWIAIEVPLYIAQYLVDNYDTDAQIKHMVDNCEIWIVPIVNPDGYEYSRTVDRNWRKNRHGSGVDLNRNWGYMWGRAGSSSSTSSSTYRGPRAFSEPETQAMRDLILAYDFQIMVDYHSYGQMICYPWGYTQNPCLDNLPMNAMSLKMINLIKETSGAVYFDWWDWPGAYVVSGDAGDWGYGELGIYSFLFELGPEWGGFIPPENRIISICEENLPAALYLISLSADDGGIENMTTGRTYNSIQFAINEASEGDEIVISEGTYQENILFRGKNVTLRSTDPNDPAIVEATVINGEDLEAAMMFSLERDSECIIDGLKITGGTVGISCRGGFPTIRNCTIQSNGPNSIEYWYDYEPTIIDCDIQGQVIGVSANDPTMTHWAFDESEGTIAYDSAGESDAELRGNPTWQPDGGMIDGALQFDGIDDYVFTPAFVLTTVYDNFSVYAWVKGGAPGQVIISQIGRKRDWLCADPAEGCLMTELRHHANNDPPLFSEAVITDGEWHRVGLVWDGANRTLYVDDMELASDEQESIGALYGDLNIGAGKNRTSGSFWSGLIDDVCIYDHAVKPFSYIQNAINQAFSGDEIVLNEGTYYENIDFGGKALKIRSTDPNDPAVVAATVINSGQQDSAITLSRSADQNTSIIAGLTIIGGTVGISCRDASPTIRNCTIESIGPNAIEFWLGYEPTIIDCNILGQISQVVDPRLMAYWKLDELEGDIAYDSAGEYDAQVYGEPTWQPDGGIIDGAIELDGIDDYVRRVFMLDTSGLPFSVFLWVKGGLAGQVIFSQANRSDWLYADATDGSLMTDLRFLGKPSQSLGSQTVITDDQWHRVGLVWDGTNRILYVDDVEVASDTYQAGTFYGDLRIGTGNKRQAGTFFSGLIDDVRIYNRAVTP